MINDKEELLQNIKDNIKTAFQDIEFIEYGHSYLHKPTTKFLTSVSKKYKEFETPFDSSIARFIAPKMGLTEGQLIDQWKEKGRISAERGTRIHKFAEDYYIDNSLQPSCDAERGVIEFFKDHPNYVMIAQEIILYNKEYNYAGTADLLMFDLDTEDFILLDFKSNEDLFKNFKKKMLLKPFTHLLQTPLNLYKIQLNLYDMCMEEKGFDISKRIIIWLSKDGMTNKNYQLFEVEDLKPILKEHYANNS